jgi:hypothetical protein
MGKMLTVPKEPIANVEFLAEDSSRQTHGITSGNVSAEQWLTSQMPQSLKLQRTTLAKEDFAAPRFAVNSVTIPVASNADNLAF